jgi:hypothetical protein
LDKQSPKIESKGDNGFEHLGEEEQQMPGAWLVWSDPEDERPGAESEEYEADETFVWSLTQLVKG